MATIVRCKWCSFSVPLSSCIAGRQNKLSLWHRVEGGYKCVTGLDVFSPFSSKTLYLFWNLAPSVGKVSMRANALIPKLFFFASPQDSGLNTAQVSSGNSQGFLGRVSNVFRKMTYIIFNLMPAHKKHKNRLCPRHNSKWYQRGGGGGTEQKRKVHLKKNLSTSRQLSVFILCNILKSQSKSLNWNDVAGRNGSVSQNEVMSSVENFNGDFNKGDLRKRTGRAFWRFLTGIHFKRESAWCLKHEPNTKELNDKCRHVGHLHVRLLRQIF